VWCVSSLSSRRVINQVITSHCLLPPAKIATDPCQQGVAGGGGGERGIRDVWLEQESREDPRLSSPVREWSVIAK
jgi:hypothetical protein